MKKSILFFLIFFAVGFSQIKVFAQTNDKVYKQAMGFYNAKQYDKAIPILENLIKDNNAEAMNMLGMASGACRMPLTKMSADNVARLMSAMQRLGMPVSVVD